jgi:monoamine oxidase
VAETLAALDRGSTGNPPLSAGYNGKNYLVTWVNNPWVHGSYAGFAPGQYTDFWGYLETPEPGLFFAGEHTSTHSQGYLNGGVESGERAANQVLRGLGSRA